MKKADIRKEAQHRFLEAFMELESAKEGKTISYAEMAKRLGLRSANGFNQEFYRRRNVAVMTLVRIQASCPEYRELVNSLLTDDADYVDEWNVEIEKIFTQARKGVLSE